MGCLRPTVKVRLNRWQGHRPLGGSGWFIGVHSRPVLGEGVLFRTEERKAFARRVGPTNPGRTLPDQSEPACPGEGLGAVPRAELAVDVARVALDGAHGDEEVPGDL